VDKQISTDELQLTDTQFRLWEVLVRFVSPVAVGLVFVMAFT